jgi:hypothetical protein
MSGKIVELPDSFIGRDDEAKLESFGAYLVRHGAATRWYWEREGPVDVAFNVCGADNGFLCAIRRDRGRGVFYVTRSERPVRHQMQDLDERLDEGKLEHIMAVVERLASAVLGDMPA